MYGMSTNFAVTHPEYCVNVDETGVNTNQKAEGSVGGELHIVGRDQTEHGRSGSATDIHFTVLVFTSGTGEPICCDVIMKSNQDPSQIPMPWRMGIDITADVRLGVSEADTIRLNVNNENVMIGGPTCFFRGVEIPTYVTCSSKVLVHLICCV